MSKRIMTKFSSFLFASIVATTIAISTSSYYENMENAQAHRLSSCMAVKSNLPMNHVNHPCNEVYMSNQSWWAWVFDDSNSINLHFLDLVELIHYSFDQQ